VFFLQQRASHSFYRSCRSKSEIDEQEAKYQQERKTVREARKRKRA
jgi:hypothetical protein